MIKVSEMTEVAVRQLTYINAVTDRLCVKEIFE